MPGLLGESARQAHAAGPLSHRALTLKNGLTVLLREDRRTPFVAVHVRYEVGALHEPEGSRGIAHLLEHLLFRATEHMTPATPVSVLTGVAARKLNGQTTFDYTEYYAVVPKVNVETALWVESERMGFPTLSTDDLDAERLVVQNERIERFENTPYMEAQYRLHQELFPQGHPYHHYAIGSEADIKRITSAEIKAFFRRHYTPANAILTLVGDFDSSVVLPMIQKYFETLVAAPRPDPPQVPPLKRSMGQLLRHTEKRGTPAALFLAWLTPPYFAPGDAACDLLGHILSRGRSGRLQRQFAAAGDATDSISVQQISRRQQSVFAITTTLPAGSASATSRLQQIDESLAQIAQDGVSDEELAIVKQWARNDLLIKTEDLLSQAHLLASYQSRPGGPASVSRDLMRYLLVGTKEIQTLARDFLSPNQRIAVIAEAKAVSASASALPAFPFRGQI